MKISAQVLKQCQTVALCLTLIATTLALYACAGQVKDPQMERFQKGLQEQREKEAKEPRVDVLIVNKALKAGDTFTEDMFIETKLPKSRVPGGALTDPKAAVGHKVAFDMKVGAVLTGKYVAP